MWTELQNLKESNEFLNLLLDNMDSAVLIADEKRMDSLKITIQPEHISASSDFTIL